MSNIEKIDQAKDKKDTFSELVERIHSYLFDDISNANDRLKLERDVSKYATQNTSDWLLNLIICIHRYGQQRKEEEA